MISDRSCIAEHSYPRRATVSRRSWLLGSAEGGGNGSRIPLSYPQKSASGAFRFAPSLLPVPQRRDAHADHPGELCLRLPQLRANRLDVDRVKLEDAAWLPFAAPNLARLPDALGQFDGGECAAGGA